MSEFGSFNPLIPVNVYADQAREAAAARLRDAAIRPVFQVHDPAKYAHFPESQNIDDQRLSQTIGQWIGGVTGGPSWEELKIMFQHPMTPFHKLNDMIYPQDASAYNSSLARDAGVDDVGGVMQHIQPLSLIPRIP